MKQKTLLIILALGLVLGGLAWLLSRNDQGDSVTPGSAMGQKVLPDFPLNDVSAITIQSKDGTVELARQEDAWKVVNRHGYNASFDQISNLIRKVWELKITQDVGIGASQFARLNLISPESPDAASAEPEKVGTLLVFKGSGDKELGRLLLGMEHSSQSAASPEMAAMGMGGFANGRYIAAGKEPKSAVLVNDSFSSASTEAKDWLDRTFIRVEKPKTISVDGGTPETSWKLVRDSETAEFTLAEPKEGEEYDTANSSQYSSVLSSPSFSDVAPKDDADATKLLETAKKVEITTFDGFTYRIQVGQGNDAGDFATKWEVSAELSKERQAPADEKPEDKEAADKSFAENLTKLEEKLAQEKALAENWVYFMPSWSLQSLQKARADLMKKPEEAPAEGGEGGPMIEGSALPSVEIPGVSNITDGVEPPDTPAPAPAPEAPAP